MCLIAFGWQPTPRWRLVLAANRDEFHGRPTAPLAFWEEAPELLAGRDLTAQGTWLGLSRRGRLAAVTNVRLPGLLSSGLRSRGALPSDFLRAEASPADWLSAQAASLSDYGPCNLLLVDATSACYASNQPGIAAQTLTAGVYGLSNAALDSPWPKTLELKSALHQWLAADQASATERLFEALANQSQPPDAELPDTGVGLARERLVAPAFIRGREYGTRCSTLVLIDADGAGQMIERRFGSEGLALGETRIAFHWPG